MYVFRSARLGFRAWKDSDIQPLFRMGTDPEVMAFFPSLQDMSHTLKLVERMQLQFEKSGFCYFAVDTLEDEQFIGFIGLTETGFEAEFTPCVDIGWRLARHAWGRGYATEGAGRCLEFAFQDCKLDSVKSFAPEVNVRSWRVMEKIGMRRIGSFNHPLLDDSPYLERCFLYEINASDETNSNAEK